jgi:hypothetical protein
MNIPLLYHFYFLDLFWLNLGDTMKGEQFIKLINALNCSNVRFFYLYGMSECFVVFGRQLLSINDTVMPVGYPLAGIRYLLIDEQGQVINHSDSSSEIGQIHLAG